MTNHLFQRTADFKSTVASSITSRNLDNETSISRNLPEDGKEAGYALPDNEHDAAVTEIAREVDQINSDTFVSVGDSLAPQTEKVTESSHDDVHESCNPTDAPKTNKRGSNKGGISHKDAYKKDHVDFLRYLDQGKPLVEIGYILNLSKSQLDKHASDALQAGISPKKPDYTCVFWEVLKDEMTAMLDKEYKKQLFKVEKLSDGRVGFSVTLHTPTEAEA